MRPSPRPILAPLLAALVALAGTAAAQDDASTNAEPQSGGTLVAAWAQDPVGLDPHVTSAYSSFQILENVLDTLVTLDVEQNVVPSLAESWEGSEDGLTLTFHLRDGLLFSDGNDLTAEDVVYTYERLLDPATGSGHAWKLEGVESITAPDPSTVVFQLAAPNPSLLTKLATDKTMGIISQENVEAGTINTAPVGSGPFMIADYQPGTSVRLERNPSYWQEGLPYLDAIDIRILPDESVRRTALVSGDVDWAISVPPQSIAELEGRDDVIVDQVPVGAYWYLGVNNEREPLDDVRVRRALAMAVDREQIAEAATFGTATATQDPIPSSSAWATDYAPYTQDVEEARRLLEEAGVGDGFELELMPTTQYEESIRIAQVVQQQLAQIGVQASIRTLEWAEWLEQQGAGNYDTFVCSWNALVDPDDYFYAQHKTGEVFNFTGYSNPEVDELLAQGRTTADTAERQEIYAQINREIVDDAPYIYLYNPLNINAYRPVVHGYQARPDQAIRFIGTWLER